jgi:glycosyltransferase involved in cell wall biosynthesis
MKVLVLTEYYPRVADPVSGIWTHRQALATNAAGAEVRVLVLHRPLPPLRALTPTATAAALRQPPRAELDGIAVEYLRYLSPPRPWSYGSWGAWAAPPLALKLRRLHRSFPFDLVHAHYAVPAGDAIRRALPDAPTLVSVHGHDVYGALASNRNVRAALAHARIVIANSEGTAKRSISSGAGVTRVVHLGTDVPDQPRQAPETPTLVTVAHLAARKRHADVLRALALLRERHPELRYEIVGDGPERARLIAQASSLKLSDRVCFRGQLPPAQSLAAARAATLFVMPSVDEAFGVAYIEAMAAGVPSIGCAGEDGPEEIAAAGEGIELVPRGDATALATKIDALLSNHAALGAAARETVQKEFTWSRCGAATLEVYEQALTDA